MLVKRIYLKRFRYKYSRSSVSPKEMAELKKVTAKEIVTIEEEYEKLKTMDIDNWEQVRGPRPWEEKTQSKNSEGKDLSEH